MRSDNNAEPFWWRTGVSRGPDGFVSAEEAIRGLPTPEEFRAALDGEDSDL